MIPGNSCSIHGSIKRFNPQAVRAPALTREKMAPAIRVIKPQHPADPSRKALENEPRLLRPVRICDQTNGISASL